jgi:5-methyltetrahydrofolate--homocysteine methyltransferase
VLERLVFPRQPKHDRICLADFYRPKDSGELDVVALQAVTAGDEVTELMARLEADGEFAEQLFVHGLGVQTAEGIAEWLHACARRDLGHRARPGPALLVGLPRLPGAVRAREGLPPARRAVDRPAPDGGYAVEPEQSTVAIVAHHPQAVYFGMKSGFLPKNDRQARDELIAGTDRDPASLDAPLPRAIRPAGRARAQLARLEGLARDRDDRVGQRLPAVDQVSSSDMPRTSRW